MACRVSKQQADKRRFVRLVCMRLVRSEVVQIKRDTVSAQNIHRWGGWSATSLTRLHAERRQTRANCGSITVHGTPLSAAAFPTCSDRHRVPETAKSRTQFRRCNKVPIKRTWIWICHHGLLLHCSCTQISTRKCDTRNVRLRCTVHYRIHGVHSDALSRHKWTNTCLERVVK